MSDSVQLYTTQRFPDDPDAKQRGTVRAGGKDYHVERMASYSATVEAMYDTDGYDHNSECDP